jgi:hypothetical protein
VLTFNTVLIYAGSDEQAAFKRHGAETVQELVNLTRAGLDVPDPRDGSGKALLRFAVRLRWALDGAARRTLMGLSSAGSTFNFEWAAVNSKTARDWRVFTPISRTAKDIHDARPPPGLSETALAAWAREHGGVRGQNLLRCEPGDAQADLLHDYLRLVITLATNTHLLVASEDGGTQT